MKKYRLLLIGLSLISCSRTKFSLEAAGGFNIGNITSIVFSQSLWQSATWPWPFDSYAALEVSYIDTDVDVNYRFLTTEGAQNIEAVYLHIQTNIPHSTNEEENISANFFVDQSDRYIYFSNSGNNYRSLNKVSPTFMNSFMLN